MTHKIVQNLLILALCAAGVVGCAAPQGDTRTEKRRDVMLMRQETLADAYRRDPSLQAKVKTAAGYGVFSGVSTHTIFVTTGNAFGVVRNNRTGQDIMMRAVKLGGGLGVGAATSRVVVVFNDPRTLHQFVTEGWSVNASGEGAVKAPDGGGAGTTFTLPGMEIYRFTETGVMLSGAVAGVKVWRDDELN